eukprot:7733313-Karenia_brevis.AAC.1
MARAPRKTCNCNGFCCSGNETRRMKIAKNQRPAQAPVNRCPWWRKKVTLSVCAHLIDIGQRCGFWGEK